MNFVSVIMLVFSMIGAFDRIIGNKLGLSKEFEKGFMLLGNMSLSMIGMIIISPLIADSLSPVFDFVLEVLHVDPSIIPASLFANDMGGAPLSKEIASDESVGMFNALVVSSMMGCTVSFTIPYALGIVEKRMHKSVFLGFLCGIVTIPVGCIAAGLLTNIGFKAFAINLLPLVLLSGIIAVGLILCPSVCVKIFSVFGIIIKTLITVGLALGIFRFLSGKELISGLATIEEGAAVCLNAAIVMTGAFPLMNIISRLLASPLKALGARIGVNSSSALGIVSSLATSMTTFEMMKDMDEKGVVINSAFAVSGAFTFAGHLAFTLAFDPAYIMPMIVGKIVAGFTAILLSILIYKMQTRNKESAETV